MARLHRVPREWRPPVRTGFRRRFVPIRGRRVCRGESRRSQPHPRLRPNRPPCRRLSCRVAVHPVGRRTRTDLADGGEGRPRQAGCGRQSRHSADVAQCITRAADRSAPGSGSGRALARGGRVDHRRRPEPIDRLDEPRAAWVDVSSSGICSRAVVRPVGLGYSMGSVVA